MADSEELAARQQLLDEVTRKIAHALHNATGLAPQAIILVVHFPEDILFSATMAAAPPQTQMNAIDRMLDHLRKMGMKLKSAVNTSRRPFVPDA